MDVARVPTNAYYVTYKDFHTGQLMRIKRRPPKLDHEILPTDRVELKFTKNDDWKEGSIETVKSLGRRNPNVLQLENSEHQTTFVRSRDVLLQKRVAERVGANRDEVYTGRYLVWP